MGYQIPDPRSASNMKQRADEYHIKKNQEHIEAQYDKIVNAASGGAYSIELELYPHEVKYFRELGYNVRKIWFRPYHRVRWN